MSTILTASTACQKSRLGTTSGSGYYTPECSRRWLWSDVFSTWTSFGGCIFWGMLDLLCEGKTLCTVRSYRSGQFIAGNKTEKSSDEPPTDQEHSSGNRADKLHRVQLTARSIISFCCHIVGEINFRFSLRFLRKALF